MGGPGQRFRPSRRVTTALLGCLVGVGGACFQGAYLEGAPCEADDDCGPSLVCVDGYCGGFGALCELTSVMAVLPSEVSAVTGEFWVTPESRSQGSCGGENGAEAFYTWTPPESGSYTVRVEVDASFFDAGLRFPTVYVKDDCTAEADLACATPTAGSRTFAATAGRPVIIVVDDLFPGEDYTQHGLRVHVDPADACISEGGEVGFDAPTSVPGRTSGFGDDLQIPVCDARAGLGYAADYVYRWTAPRAGTFSFDTLQSSMDTVMYLLDGDCGGQLLACNDDSHGSATPGGSSVATEVTKGQEVLVVVDGVVDDGEFELRVEDAFGCVDVDLGSSVPDGGITGDLNDAKPPDFPVLFQDESLVYKFQAPTKGLYRFSTDDFEAGPYDGTQGPPIIGYTGSCRGSLRANSNVQGSFVHMPMSVALEEGEVILLSVGPAWSWFAGGSQPGFTLVADTAVCPSERLEGALPVQRNGTLPIQDSMRVRDPVGSGCGSPLDPTPGAGRIDQTFEFTAPEAGRYEVFHRALDDGDALVYVLDGGCTGPLLGCAADDSEAKIEVDLTAGQTITIVVDGGDPEQALPQDTPFGEEPGVPRRYELTVRKLEAGE